MGKYAHAAVPRAGTLGVHHLVAARVGERPDACAVRDARGGPSLTYRQLWEQAGRLAHTLATHGVAPGEPVAVDLERGTALIVALLGVARAGAAYLPLDAQAPAERVATVLADAGVRTVLVGEETGEGRTAGIPGVQQVAVDRPAPDHRFEVPEVPVDGDSPLYIGYTSGSTGTPKGVVVPHRAVRRLVTDATFCTIAPGDRVGQAANPAFDATTFEVWGALTAGATLVVLPTVVDLAVDRWAALLQAEDITTLFLTTSLFHLVARTRPGALHTLRNLVVGGEQLDLAAVRAVLAAGPPQRLVNGYGPTEATVFATSFDCTDASLAGRDRIPIGRAIQQTTLHVLDEELRPVAPGQPGELCIGGPGVAKGYLGRPEHTARAFVPEPGTGTPMYRTGDLVRELPDGELELVGRADRQVKLRGYRIELEEIERAALATGLAEAAFVSKVGEGPAARLAGAFLPSDGTERGGAEELAAALARALPAYMLPASWLPLASLPLHSTGKADRGRIDAMIEAATASVEDSAAEAAPSRQPAGPSAPSSGDPVTDALTRIWTEVLGTPATAPDQDFLSLGGNSLLATQAAARIREVLAADVEPYDILLAAGIGELAGRVRESAEAV
ncbi:non-ribosomal peptide synthetase [Streptomyces violens]|uniref:non-ribosomal peptide synthetase n=1 Tax=Streptomyces violens TaxID=66377 RepID=UPI000997EE51|nr:non-ribosomal peptide synthetase [Streptomyces violens]